MPRLETIDGSKIFTLRVVLDGSDPAIWRRIQIPGDATLGDLHYTLQIAMGWTNSHLHEFQISRRSFGMMLPDDADPLDGMEDEEEFEIAEVLKRKGMKFTYVYDFGDGWLHDVVVEDIAPAQKDVRYPVCLDGAQACPPDDCGGIDGYYRMLDILKNPKHEEYQTYRDWLPDDFDPNAFDLAEINEGLDRIDEWRGMAEEGDDYVIEEDSEGAEYEPPVSQLFMLGTPQPGFDYLGLGIGQEHIPELVRMSVDTDLQRVKPQDAVIWAPLHAWRALHQIQTDALAESSGPLSRMLEEEQGEQSAEPLPTALGQIGCQAIMELSDCMQDESEALWKRIASSANLREIAECYQEEMDACVTALTAQLRHFSKNGEGVNSFLVSALMDLDAVEAAPVIERAFAARSVDPSLKRHWEEFRTEFGLGRSDVAPEPDQKRFVPRVLEKPTPSPAADKKHAKAKKTIKSPKK